MGTLEIISIALNAVIVAAVTALTTSFRSFAKEQRDVNKANAEANRSMQRDVLYRYFHKAVELGEPLTPEEFKHVSDCANAYQANGGNGTGTVMWDRIREFAKIDTGRENDD